jgi:hypothetical protein
MVQEGGSFRHAEARDFRRAYSRDVRIRLIGVWDTVGALGPSGLTKVAPLFDRMNERWAFHDTGLSRIVDRGAMRPTSRSSGSPRRPRRRPTETIDDSLRRRLQEMGDYRPRNSGLGALLAR